MESGLVGSETELANRVLSLLHINEQAEETIRQQQVQLKRADQRIARLERKSVKRDDAFRQAIEDVDHHKKLAEDLRAENRTLRVALRGFSLVQHPRLDDPKSDGYGSVQSATNANAATQHKKEDSK